MKKRNTLCLLLLLGMSGANASDVLYTIAYSQSTWIGMPGSAVISSNQGPSRTVHRSGNGVLHLFENSGAVVLPFGRHTLSVDFMSPDYFNSNGHFALFARASLAMNAIHPDYPYRGHGATIGNVSQYPSHTIAAYGSTALDCGPAANAQAVTIEVAGVRPQQDPAALPNCVFGPETGSSQSLLNGAWYRLIIQSDYEVPNYTTRYHLYQCEPNIGCVLGESREKVYQYAFHPPFDAAMQGGWLLLEVFNEMPWTLHLRNPQARWEDISTTRPIPYLPW